MEERLNKLESDLAYQEHTIDQLNQVVTAQQDQIDALKKEIDRLREEMQRSSQSTEINPAQEKPPHY